MPDPGNGGSSEIGGTPSTGMFFYHQNLLGSTDMLTDGTGNVTTGAGQEGASHVSYKPYGEIDRADSSGPDIFSYKYTGQIEDTPTELYYYKSRYYDPVLGRFIQPDSIVEPGNLFGMNQYMYVNGNPINYNDPTGNSSEIIHEINKWIRDTIHSFNHLGGEHHSTAFFPQMSDYVNGQVGQTTKWNTTQWAIVLAAVTAGVLLSIATDGIAGAAFDDLFSETAAQAASPYFAGFAGGLIAGSLAQATGYLIGRAIGGLDHMNIHASNWDKASADAMGPLGANAGSIGVLGYAIYDATYKAYDEYTVERKELEEKSNEQMSRRVRFFNFGRSKLALSWNLVNYMAYKAFAAALEKEITSVAVSAALRSAGVFVSDYAGHHTSDLIKENNRLAERPESESLLEEGAKEYLLDKLREGGE